MRMLLTFLAALTAVSGLAELQAADQPNVVIVITDDQGYGDLSWSRQSDTENAEHRQAAFRVGATARLPRRADLLADASRIPHRTLDEPNRRLAHDHGPIDAPRKRSHTWANLQRLWLLDGDVWQVAPRR